MSLRATSATAKLLTENPGHFRDAASPVSNGDGLIRPAVKRGVHAGRNLDLLLAAIALSRDCVLVTRNTREFARVPGLRTDSWP